MTTDRRGADALVHALQAAGVRVVFTVSGNHIMSVFDAALSSNLRLVHARHEAATVHMADAWSRVTGEVGVALVTGGPGHANAVSALYTARMAEAPIVLLSGHAPAAQLGMGAFQEMAQADVAAPLAKSAWTCASAEAVAADVSRAIRIARSGRPGPVHVSLPSDVLEGRAQAPVGASEGFDPAPQTLGDEALRAVEAHLDRAQRPVILTGPVAMTKHGRIAARVLEQATGIPVVGMESPRGIADPALGAFAEVLARADCVVLIGKRVDFTLRFGNTPALAASSAVLHIDAEAQELARSQRALGERLQWFAVADAEPAMLGLARAMSWDPAKHAAWLDHVDEAVRYRPAEWRGATASTTDRLHPIEALQPVQALLDSHPDAVLICDGGEFGQWAQACLAAPHRVINGMAGSIGSALPYAVGARCAIPDAPVVAALGDGTFGFHPAEIDTAVRYHLPFVAVIGNDARWNAEYQIQLREYGPERAHGCELRPTRYDLVAAAFGGYGELVTDAAQMTGALRRAQEARLPACLNVMLDGVAAPQYRR